MDQRVKVTMTLSLRLDAAMENDIVTRVRGILLLAFDNALIVMKNAVDILDI